MNELSELKTILVIFNDTCRKYSIIKEVSKGEERGIVNEKNIDINNSSELMVYFDVFEPCGQKIETGFTPIVLFSRKQLDKAKVGYENLERNLVIIADDDGGGKPIIAMTGAVDTPILASYDTGRAIRIAGSLGEFIRAMIELIEIVYGSYSIFDIADDDDLIRVGFVKELEDRVKPILGDENYGCFYDYFYG